MAGKNRDYSRKYRENHEKYTEENREKQKERNKKRTGSQTIGKIAKMDASILKKLLKPGRYEIETVHGGVIAKMDVSITEFHVISTSNDSVLCRRL